MNRTLMRENAFRLLYSLEVPKNKELNTAEQIDLYLPYDNGNAKKVSEEVFKDVPAHYIVTDKESCISAMKAPAGITAA